MASEQLRDLIMDLVFLESVTDVTHAGCFLKFFMHWNGAKGPAKQTWRQCKASVSLQSRYRRR
jgi:hypothetical protein